MDPRIREHASVLVDWSARIETGDNVVVDVDEGAHDLGIAVLEKLGDIGANVVTTYGSEELTRAYLTAHEGEFEADPPHELSLFESTDAYLRLRAGRNTAAMADIEEDIRQSFARARQSIREARLATDWVLTVHPTRSLAQQAGMSYEEYQDFVYGAILRDWESFAEEMATLKDILDSGSTVQIQKEHTDITMSIENRTAVNSAASVAYDSHNLPSGEVFTAPYATEGTVYFDVPMTINSQRVQDVSLTFENGEVVDFEANSGEDVLAGVLETDDGAKRLGELGIGMNRGIDRFTDSILFDEKMGDTVHMALGRAYAANLPDGETGNESAVHVDLITDMRSDATMLVDGDIIQRNGTFRWEPGFES